MNDSQSHPEDRPQYWYWVKNQATLHDSDGCTLVTGIRVECCWEHDLSYARAKDPRSAYRRFQAGYGNGAAWQFAAPIDRATADSRFRSCIQQRSTLGRWSPLSWVRWLGVKIGGQKAWDKHRARETQAAPT